MNADRINEHYYGEPTDPKTERARARVHWLCSQASGSKVLDIGCSQGIVSLILGREGFHCTGIDLEERSLAVAKEALLKEDALVRRRVKFQASNAFSLPFEIDSFDTVILGEVLEHLTRPGKVLGEALRVLRDGGRLVVTVPYGLNAFHDHKHTYYPLSLLDLLQPLLRTELIDTLNNYIVYRGVKDTSYAPPEHPTDELYRTALRLHRQVEARCSEKERELLGTATRFQKQLKTLTEQCATQRKAIENLKATLEAREHESSGQQKLIRDLQHASDIAGEKASDEQRTRALKVQAAEQKAAELGGRVAELESRATASDCRTQELTRLLDQATAAAAAVQRLTTSREAEQVKRLEEQAAQSVRQAAVIRELQQSAANKDLRIQDLCRALDESRAASDEVRRAQGDHIGSLNERMGDQRTTLDHLEDLVQTQQKQILAEQRAQHEALRQTEPLREQLRTTLEKFSLLQQELQASRHSAREQQERCDSLQNQVTDLTAQLQGNEDAVRQQVEAIETRFERELRARVSEINDLTALLDARGREHQRELETTAKKRDIEWERRLLNQRIRKLVRDNTPDDAQVLVISKGDEDLLHLDGRRGQHFPQTEDGVYAGYHPGDSQEAISHLEDLRAKGAQYIVVPQTSYWWLEFYRELREHLDHQARLVAFDEDTGALYDLSPVPTGVPVRVTVAPRRNGHPERPGIARRPKLPQPSNSIAKVTEPATRPSPQSTPQLGVILDEFTMGCLAPECGLLTFRPDNWLRKLDQNRPQALFVESAWRGNEGAWLYRVAQYQRNMGNELAELLQWAKQHDIPSVFWNKEDPVHFDRFIERAKLFSHVCTTDADCIPKYRELVGHDRVFALPFAAQPAIHNPIHDSPRPGRVCFAGTYYGNRHEQRLVDMDYVLRPAIPFGLDIYDRQYGLKDKGAEAYRFPDIYQSCIKGRLDYEDMVRAYRDYRVFLNVNSVKQSPTMFSRRVFELLACGTPVVSTYSRGIVDLLGDDVVFITESEADTRRHLDRLLGDEEAWARASTRGIRKVMQSHTYQRRLDEVFHRAGMLRLPRTETGFSVLLQITSVDELRSVAPMLRAQTYRRFDVVILSATPLSGDALQSFQNALGDVPLTRRAGPPEAQFEPCLQASDSDHLAFLDPADLYGPDYLMDYALGIRYSGAGFLGKHSHFVEHKHDAHLRQAGSEYRWVTDVPSSSLIVKKAAMIHADFLRALQNPVFQRQSGPVLSIDRFNYLRHEHKSPAPAEQPSLLVRRLQEISA